MVKIWVQLMLHLWSFLGATYLSVTTNCWTPDLTRANPVAEGNGPRS